MTETVKTMLLQALELKEASIKRAQKQASARFAPVYEQELADLGEARAWVTKTKVVQG